MPFYEYRCKKCENEFEELVDMDNSDNIPCPKCGKKKTEKLISKQTSFKLKGHGWTGVSREALMKRNRR